MAEKKLEDDLKKARLKVLIEALFKLREDCVGIDMDIMKDIPSFVKIRVDLLCKAMIAFDKYTGADRG